MALPHAARLDAFRRGRGARRADGFTLIEVLLAAGLGALLLIAMAGTTTVFAGAKEILDGSGPDSIDGALARISRDVRYAWWVDVPASDRLVTVDGRGAMTEYRLSGSDLRVMLPTGESGALVSDVASLRFEAATLRRLREGAVRQSSATILDVARARSADKVVELMSGSTFGVGFTLPESAGSGRVAGVTERLVYAEPDTLRMGLASGSGFVGLLTFEIYPSAAVGDARPKLGAAALATQTIELKILPTVALDLTKLDVDGGMVEMCVGGRTRLIALALVPTTLAAGGTLGECGEPFLGAFRPAATETNLALTFSGVKLQPGVGYTLLMSTSGIGAISILNAVARTKDWSVVTRPVGASSFSQSDYDVPLTFSGRLTSTTTDERQVAGEITTTLVTAGGETRSCTAANLGQMLASDPWMGVVPGEAAPIP